MASDSPKVSIILPTYNGSKFLRGAIETCLSQTHRNLELIAVDDCSTDSSPEIIRSFKDPRIVYVRNPQNLRLPRSLNAGFRRATGGYLTWTSDDNEYLPDAIEKMLDRLQSAQADFTYADYWSLDESTHKKEMVRVPDALDLGTKNDVAACFLYTRRAYQAIGDYNPHYEMVEDYDYWVRIAKRFKTVRTEGPLYLYRYHSASLTSTRQQNQELFDRILKYRNGYLPLSQLGWCAAYYFENMKKAFPNKEEHDKILKRTLSDISALSTAFFALFMTVSALYTVRKQFQPKSSQ